MTKYKIRPQSTCTQIKWYSWPVLAVHAYHFIVICDGLWLFQSLEPHHVLGVEPPWQLLKCLCCHVLSFCTLREEEGGGRRKEGRGRREEEEGRWRREEGGGRRREEEGGGRREERREERGKRGEETLWQIWSWFHQSTSFYRQRCHHSPPLTSM